MEMESHVIELIDENNEVVQFEHLLTLDFGDREYMVLLPMEEEDDIDTEEGEVVILRVEQDDEGNDIYVSIEDEEELEEVFQAFLQVMAQEEAFDDDEEDR
ncbi:uncharacterized protein YrzB (UPF0473 family) [Caldicoprobacter guelmensis]|uniref:DUF1292 domain-containing protein n=1 Tax=Caldicoprobacter guelmensis TaxID=1170224 RepID=UPI00195A36A3|nr:DUF1292 domain-containing protein [Caldicoprobacter guelmensis]MBM7581372.1 uncharacterized protein YrzB (UPF0473 family) [Caldicoprobacter guelmensis]